MYSKFWMFDSEATFALANISSIIAQSFLYGVFVLLFIVSIYFLIQPTTTVAPNNGLGHNRSPNIVILVTTMLLFLLVTVSWIIRILTVVWFIQGKLYFTDIALPVHTAQVALYIFQVWLADVLMVYRLYVVWDCESWICAFPALCWLVATVLGVFIIINESSLNGFESSTGFQSKEDKFVIIAYCTTLALNLFCTAMISRRIWAVSRSVKEATHDQSGSRLSWSIRILVDSVTITLYFATLLAYIMEKSGTVALALVYCTGPVAGLSFCLITVRVGLSRIHSSNYLYNKSSMYGYPPSGIAHSPTIVINATRESQDDALELGAFWR